MTNSSSIPVLLVVPPFYAYGQPSLGPAALKSALTQQGISSRVIYANAWYANMVGIEFYRMLLSVISPAELYQEQIFATAAHGAAEWRTPVGEHAADFYTRYYELYGNNKTYLTDREFARAVEAVEPFIEAFVNEIKRIAPRIVGFSSLYSQINATLAMARRLKEALPGVLVVAGGSNCCGDMGDELKNVAFIDYVFDGEADIALPEFCANVLGGQALPRDKVVKCQAVVNLDDLEIPDYSDFMAQFRPEERDTSFLYFETSRGCWWGMKHRCRFCGISYAGMAFRAKSATKAAEQLCKLRRLYPDFSNYYACDSVFPFIYSDEFFATLAAHEFDGSVFYQVKPTLNFEDLKRMKGHGINSLGPGIESLSSKHLALMKKGTTAGRNIALLRDCRELNIEAKWNHLVAIPKDCGADYHALAKLLPLLQHLDPPVIIPIYIQRFSPYFDYPEEFEIRDVRPMSGYGKSFPDTFDLMRLAYNFNGTIDTDVRATPELLVPFYIEVWKWYGRWAGNRPELTLIRSKDTILVRDTRDCAVDEISEINEKELTLLKQCRSPLKKSSNNGEMKNLLERGFLIEIDNCYVSLVCDRHEETLEKYSETAL